jgi:hypothetical protein
LPSKGVLSSARARLCRPKRRYLGALPAYFRGLHEEEPVNSRRGPAPALPPALAQYFAPGHHEELARRAERWVRRGISLDAIATQLKRYARFRGNLEQNTPRWRREARTFRTLRLDLVTVLDRVLALYENYPGRPVSPLETHAKEMLRYLAAAERASRGQPTPGITIDFSDLLVPPIPGRRGPRTVTTSFARDQLSDLGLARRDVTWILLHSTDRFLVPTVEPHGRVISESVPSPRSR